MHVCMHVWMDGWMYGCICIYICMYVCNVCMYVFMYVCMVGPQARLFFPRAERWHGLDEDGKVPCHQVPHLPRKVKVHVAKCHACHAKRRSMSPSATPATQTAVCGQVACVDVCEEVVCEEVV